MKIIRILVLALSFLQITNVLAQEVEKNNIIVDYEDPQKYIVGGVEITGTKTVSKEQILSLCGLRIGEEVQVPSETLTDRIKRIWVQRYFANVSFYVDSLSAKKDTAFFRLDLQERPRVSLWSFRGIKNSEQTELMERLALRKGGEISEFVVRSSTNIILDYYKEKGFNNAKVNVIQKKDTLIRNAVRVIFDISKGKRVRIKLITYEGNDHVPEGKLDRSMKKTKDNNILNFFSSKKFNEDEYVNDKKSLVTAFNEQGFRDAKIVKDSIYTMEDGKLGIHFVIDEGKRYYFRNITWTGNSLYREEDLNSILKISKGDIYDLVTMEKRLFGDGTKKEMDVASLYRDRGYLFFNIDPVEINIQGDSVDVEMRMREGKPATFNKIIITGNDITNEKVVRRQIFTKPGYLYSQSQLERSIREISSMGHFDPEHAMDQTKGFFMNPNQMNNTVDITYNVAEKPNSQFELSGGWGGYSFVGSVGVSFNNFSINRLFKKKSWRPVPLGDAQVLSLRFQTNGTYYTAFSLNFMEPWLTGKKPTSLNISAYYTRQTDSYYYYLNSEDYMEVYGAAAGIGKRLNWPDNYFVMYNELSWQTYRLHNWGYDFLFPTGISHNLSYKIAFTRNSTDQPVYPREGSDFTLSLQLTPPYSLFRDKNTDYNSLSDQDKYRWIEYHKWTFKAASYIKLVGDLVLMPRVQFGYLGSYNRALGYSPFEGYQVGGDGMSGYNTYGAEIISLRGYENYSLTPRDENGTYIGHIYDKFTVELRYPVILQPQSQIFVLAFLEGGNCWEDIRDFNPFSIKRSAGVGARIMLPMVGLLGVDWGWGFDPIGTKKVSGSQFHFLIGQQF